MDRTPNPRQQVTTLLDLGRPQEAFEAAQQSLVQMPNDRNLLALAALAQLRLSNLRLARQYSEQSLAADPTYAFGQLTLAYTYLPNRPRRALAEFERAVAMDPDNYANHLGVSRAVWRIAGAPLESNPPIQNPIWCRKSEITRAVEAADRAASLEPTSADAHIDVARAAFLDRRYRDALTAADTARELDPMDAHAAEVQATVLKRLGLHTEAGDSLVSAVRAQPERTAAVTRLQQVKNEGSFGLVFIIVVLAAMMTFVAFADPEITIGDIVALIGTYLFCGAFGVYFWIHHKRAKSLSAEAKEILEQSTKLG